MLASERERTQQLLTEAVLLLCKNSLHYQDELKVEAVISLMFDRSDVLTINIKDTLSSQPVFYPPIKKRAAPKCQNQAPAKKKNRKSPQSNTKSDLDVLDDVTALPENDIVPDITAEDECTDLPHFAQIEKAELDENASRDPARKPHCAAIGDSLLAAHTCRVCGETCKSAANLRYHRYKVHRNTGSQHLYRCNKQCGACFFEPSALASHVCGKTVSQAFECTECDTVFTTERGLRAHLTQKHRAIDIDHYTQKYHIIDADKCAPAALPFQLQPGSSGLNLAAIPSTTLTSSSARLRPILPRPNTVTSSPIVISVITEPNSVDEQNKKEETMLDNLSKSKWPVFDGAKCICLICGKNFQNANTLRVHKMKAHPMDNIHYVGHICQICKIIIPSMTELKKHLREDHGGETQNELQDPNPIFAHHSSPFTEDHVTLPEHLHCVSEEPAEEVQEIIIYKCQVCEGLCDDIATLAQHMQDDHATVVSQCENCGGHFAGEAEIAQHLAQCVKVANDDMRVKEVVPEDVYPVDPTIITPDKSKAVCTICGDVFKNKNVLRGHRFRKHRHLTTVKSVIGNKELPVPCGRCMGKGSEDPNSPPCSSCGRKTLNLSEMKMEDQSESTVTFALEDDIPLSADSTVIVVPLRCEECSFECESTLELKIHVARHHRDASLQCDTCGASFHWHCDLKGHLDSTGHRSRDASGEVFMCQTCNMSFLSIQILKRHIDYKHTDQADSSAEPSWVCEICLKVCTSDEMLQSHAEKDHPELVMSMLDDAETEDTLGAWENNAELSQDSSIQLQDMAVQPDSCVSVDSNTVYIQGGGHPASKLVLSGDVHIDRTAMEYSDVVEISEMQNQDGGQMHTDAAAADTEAQMYYYTQPGMEGQVAGGMQAEMGDEDMAAWTIQIIEQANIHQQQ